MKIILLLQNNLKNVLYKKINIKKLTNYLNFLLLHQKIFLCYTYESQCVVPKCHTTCQRIHAFFLLIKKTLNKIGGH